MFEKFPSLTRFSHGWTITEKLDGTNACVLIVPEAEWPYRSADVQVRDVPGATLAQGTLPDGQTVAVLAQSRSRLITPDSDNHGFARWVKDNAEKLVELLGAGRHFGEWVGKGINKRGYNLNQKVFALFNTHRWAGMNELDGRLRVVPVLAEGYMGEPGAEFERVMSQLKLNGSLFAPGFADPEGLVMRHGPSGTLFKKTFDYDEQGKWAENEARRREALA